MAFGPPTLDAIRPLSLALKGSILYFSLAFGATPSGQLPALSGVKKCTQNRAKSAPWRHPFWPVTSPKERQNESILMGKGRFRLIGVEQITILTKIGGPRRNRVHALVSGPKGVQNLHFSVKEKAQFTTRIWPSSVKKRQF